jgi:hypothetical protein
VAVRRGGLAKDRRRDAQLPSAQAPQREVDHADDALGFAAQVDARSAVAKGILDQRGAEAPDDGLGKGRAAAFAPDQPHLGRRVHERPADVDLSRAVRPGTMLRCIGGEFVDDERQVDRFLRWQPDIVRAFDRHPAADRIRLHLVAHDLAEPGAAPAALRQQAVRSSHGLDPAGQRLDQPFARRGGTAAEPDHRHDGCQHVAHAMIELGHQRRVALLLRLLLGHVGEGQHGAGHAALVVDECGAAEAAYQRRPLVVERDPQLLPVQPFRRGAGGRPAYPRRLPGYRPSG